MKSSKGMVRYIAATSSIATRYGVPVGDGDGLGQADTQGHKVGNPPQGQATKHTRMSCSKVPLAHAVETNRGLETQVARRADAVQSEDKCLKVR